VGCSFDSSQIRARDCYQGIPYLKDSSVVSTPFQAMNRRHGDTEGWGLTFCGVARLGFSQSLSGPITGPGAVRVRHEET